jgi:hypothetical protein
MVYRYLTAWIVLITITFLGAGILFGLGLSIVSHDRLDSRDLVLIIASGLGFGATLGMAESFVLRLRNVLAWTLASALGGLVGGSVWTLWIHVIGLNQIFGDYSTFGIGALMKSAEMGITVAAPMAMLQWLVLRLQIRGAGWWIFASVAGSGMGWATIPLLGGLDVVTASIVGVVYALVTGITLVNLLEHPLAEGQAAGVN